MAVAICIKHPQVEAIGKCSRCQKPYCLECLDIETGAPICQDCLKKPAKQEVKPAPVVPKPAPPVQATSSVPLRIKKDTFISVDDLNMEMKIPGESEEKKGPSIPEELTPVNLPDFKVMDQDPLGLFKVESIPKASTPSRADNPSLAESGTVPASEVSDLGTHPPMDLNSTGLLQETPPPALSTPKSGADVFNSLMDSSVQPAFELNPLESFNEKPKVSSVSRKAAAVSNSDSTNRVDHPDTPSPAVLATESNSKDPISDQGKISIRDLHAPSRSWMDAFFSLGGNIWLRVNLISSKFRIPGYLLVAIILVLVAGGVTLVSQWNGNSVVTVVDSIPLIYIIPTDASQVVNLDITAFSDLQNQLGDLGFSQILQMTIPQLPAPNFFDVGLKPDEQTYSEILIMPSQIEPRISFVTVFINGAWYSTNGWEGSNQQSDEQVSEFYPDETPAQLYEQHRQGIEKLQTANHWQIQPASLNRYMSDLSDHLRCFLTSKNIPAYEANFASWH